MKGKESEIPDKEATTKFWSEIWGEDKHLREIAY